MNKNNLKNGNHGQRNRFGRDAMNIYKTVTFSQMFVNTTPVCE